MEILHKIKTTSELCQHICRPTTNEMSRDTAFPQTSGNSAEDWRIFEILCEDITVSRDKKVSGKKAKAFRENVNKSAKSDYNVPLHTCTYIY